MEVSLINAHYVYLVRIPKKKSPLTFHMFLTTVKFICEMLFENLLSLFYPALQDTFQALQHKVVV